MANSARKVSRGFIIASLLQDDLNVQLHISIYGIFDFNRVFKFFNYFCTAHLPSFCKPYFQQYIIINLKIEQCPT